MVTELQSLVVYDALITTVEQKAKERGYDENFIERLKKHLQFVSTYPGYGAPEHLNYVLIQVLDEIILDFIVEDKEK